LHFFLHEACNIALLTTILVSLKHMLALFIDYQDFVLDLGSSDLQDAKQDLLEFYGIWFHSLFAVAFWQHCRWSKTVNKRVECSCCNEFLIPSKCLYKFKTFCMCSLRSSIQYKMHLTASPALYNIFWCLQSFIVLPDQNFTLPIIDIWSSMTLVCYTAFHILLCM